MNLSAAFFRHAAERPDAPALWVDRETWTYGALAHLAEPPLGLLRWPRTPSDVTANEGAGPYWRILSLLRRGCPYVPARPGVAPPIEPTNLPRDLAYIMFTSGSTGEPKGVPISHANALAYVRHTADRLNVGPASRCSHMHDLTFDFSVHDLWVAWERGACVYTVPKEQRFAPAYFIREHELTHWASVPSVLASMDKLNLLEPGAFPSLERAVFCGEALPMRLCAAFQAAAPNCTIENIYGPTECTVAVTAYEWHERSPDECENGIVPIGWPFPGHDVRIVDGELHVRGPQVFGGYWPEMTGSEWYATGDIVTQDATGCLHFVGRKDSQIQVRGHRVELGAVEARYREHGAEAVCIGWPIEDGMAQGIAAFVRGQYPPLDQMWNGEPLYRRPHMVVPVANFPLNANGKIDRAALRQSLGGT